MDVMIVSKSERSVCFLRELLGADAGQTAVASSSCEEARRLAERQDFALCIIDAPLPDGPGFRLARYMAGRITGQVVLITAGQPPDALEEDGILVLTKPGSRALYAASLKAVAVAQRRMQAVREENRALKGKLDDLRLIDRAKCILVSQMKMEEREAHRYIEKQAMDRRMTKRAIAEGILKTYET